MRKSLLASTALVGAAALLAAPAAAEVKVSAFAQFHASALDQDDARKAGAQDYDFTTNTEVNFSGSHELDNGLTFGFQVQLEADVGRGRHTHGSVGDTFADDTGLDKGAEGGTAIIDENDVWVSGSFGKVVFGNQDGAADSMMVQGSAVGVGFGGIGNPTFSGVTAVTNKAPTSSDVSDSGDAIKITYYTPRFSGIQAGVSFAPDLDSGSDSSNAGTWDGGPGTGLENFVELGLNYNETVNGVGITAAVVGVFADSPIGKDRTGFGVGLKLDFAGFSVAGGYAQTEDDGLTGDTLDASVFDLGVGYSTGPWTVALGAVWSEEDVSGDEWQLYAGTVNYVIGEGLSVYGTITAGTDETTASGDNDFTVFTTGIKASF